MNYCHTKRESVEANLAFGLAKLKAEGAPVEWDIGDSPSTPSVEQSVWIERRVPVQYEQTIHDFIDALLGDKE